MRVGVEHEHDQKGMKGVDENGMSWKWQRAEGWIPAIRRWTQTMKKEGVIEEEEDGEASEEDMSVLTHAHIVPCRVMCFVSLCRCN